MEEDDEASVKTFFLKKEECCELKSVDLQRECKKRKLKSGGRKKQLVSRLVSFDKYMVNFATFELSEVNSLEFEGSRIVDLKVPGLKKLCKKRRLNSVGKKIDLLTRLLDFERDCKKLLDFYDDVLVYMFLYFTLTEIFTCQRASKRFQTLCFAALRLMTKLVDDIPRRSDNAYRTIAEHCKSLEVYHILQAPNHKAIGSVCKMLMQNKNLRSFHMDGGDINDAKAILNTLSSACPPLEDIRLFDHSRFLKDTRTLLTFCGKTLKTLNLSNNNCRNAGFKGIGKIFKFCQNLERLKFFNLVSAQPVMPGVGRARTDTMITSDVMALRYCQNLREIDVPSIYTTPGMFPFLKNLTILRINHHSDGLLQNTLPNLRELSVRACGAMCMLKFGRQLTKLHVVGKTKPDDLRRILNTFKVLKTLMIHSRFTEVLGEVAAEGCSLPTITELYVEKLELSENVNDFVEVFPSISFFETAYTSGKTIEFLSEMGVDLNYLIVARPQRDDSEFLGELLGFGDCFPNLKNFATILNVMYCRGYFLISTVGATRPGLTSNWNSIMPNQFYIRM